MFEATCRRIARARCKDWNLLGPRFSAPQDATFFSSFSSENSNVVNGADPEQSFTFSYLVNSCGLSSNDALSVSKKISIKSPEKPDAVLKLLEKYGFTNAHLPKLVTRWPSVLQACPEKTLLPKLEFFSSIGVPAAILAKNLSVYPSVLHLSLKDYLVPSYNYLKSIVKSDERVVKVFLREPRAFAHGWRREIPTNIAILRERGVSASYIVSLITCQPSLLILGREKLAAYADRVVEMGFDGSKSAFIQALQVFAHMTESTLKRKMDAYKRFGWSESDITSAFLKYPFCMKYSEEKILASMDFLINKLGCEPAAVAHSPVLLSYNLEKRIKPRCSVIGILKSKGLLNETLSVTSLVMMSEAKFLKGYIIKYQKDIPELKDMYKGS